MEEGFTSGQLRDPLALIVYMCRVCACQVPGGIAVCEAGGIEAWLDKTGSCPTCREEYKVR